MMRDREAILIRGTVAAISSTERLGIEEVRKLFGDERAKEFGRVSDMFYINARRGAEENGVPLEQVDSAWQVTVDARAKAAQLAADSSLPIAQRKEQVAALQQQAEARLNELLGSKGASSVTGDLRVVLGATQYKGQ